MTKRYLHTLLCLLLATAAFAQTKFNGIVPVAHDLQPAPFLKTALLPHEQYLPEPENPSPVVEPAVTYRDDEVVSLTTWDAQSYGCMPSRIYADGNGNPVVTWIYGTDLAGGFAERGTGYNTRNNGSWPNVTQRVETVRTGFPASARLSDGTEIIVAHSTSFTPYAIRVARRASGASNWTETNLGNPAGAGCLWPRVAVGGQDGKTVHVIAITTPVANAGTAYEGVDGQVLYWRSTDGGLNWDQKHVIIPGLDSSKITQLNADSYTIDANGETVGIAVFPDWNDLLLFKSFDNGSSWETTVVNDFPDALENYKGALNDTYTIDDIGYIDPNAPDTLAVFTSDGFGSLLIDDGAQAHLWFGRMYIIDNDPAAGSFYYPGMNGLCYWNESLGPNNISIITGALDYDGDTSLTISGGNAAIGPYYNSLSSFATTGIGPDGTLYLVYSAFHELYRSDWGAEKDQYYRHLYAMKSTDNGANWGQPYELTAAPYIAEDFIPYIESVWPAIPRRISGDNMWVIYQQDGTPGTDLWGDNHGAGENSINWFEVPTAAISAFVGVDNPAPPASAFDLALTPNPASTVAQLAASFDTDAPVLIEVFDMTGLRVQQQRLPAGGVGRQNMLLPVQNLSAGTYFVRVTQNGLTGTVKLLKI